MKKSGFKMKGYSYPGTSPLKGKAAEKRAAAGVKQDDAMNEFNDQDDYTSTKLAPSKPMPTGVLDSPFELDVGSIILTSALEAVVGAGVEAGIGELTKDRKPTRGKGGSGDMNQNFGKSGKSIVK